MRSFFLSAFAVVAVSSGCAQRPRPPAAAPVTARAPLPMVQAGSLFALPPPNADPGSLPRSIRQIVGEQKDALQQAAVLSTIVGDERGRARAESEVRTLSTELAAIELRLDPADSTGLDRSFSELRLLGTRIEILHDSLRAANPDPGAPKERE